MVDCGDLAIHMAAVQVRCSAAGLGRGGALEHAALLAEVQALAACIHRARRDLSALAADDIVDRHVPAAADELDAIISHTAAATSTILDQCERLEQAIADPACRPLISAATARIYEACSFQDITGQRVAKVVQTLQLVEARVNGILRVFGRAGTAGPSAIQPAVLMSGPQRPKDAMDQGAVDALLAGFE